MLEYQLGEMRGIHGDVLKYEVEEKASELAIHISYSIESTDIFKQLVKILPSRRVLMYFQYIVKQEIYPFVRQACVIKWYKRNGKEISLQEGVVKAPKLGIFMLLKECWNFEDIPILLVNQIFLGFTSGSLLKKLIKDNVKSYSDKVRESSIKFRKNNYLPFHVNQCGTIACHYSEGIDPSRRNDLNWYFESGVEPERILIYFDINSSRGKSIGRKIIQKIECQRFNWVSLEKGIIEGNEKNYWQPSRILKNMLFEKGVVQNKIEAWIIKVANDLIKQVHFWCSFYDDFNIKINYTPEEGMAKNIAQAIAFDIKNGMSGFLAGKQRSEFLYQPTSFIGVNPNPKHVLFIWNERGENYFKHNYGREAICIVSGFTNNIYQKYENYCQKLRSKGVKFIIALFDSMCGPDLQFSMNSMAKFYQSFLQLMLDDSTIGLIIKSKKPFVINNLTTIHPLFIEAIESGRCIKLENELGRFPSDASFGADIAVGCGISSAVVEAVIAGCRGIHYDMTYHRNHVFYKWGYERFIFNDLEKMIAAIKSFKINPDSNLDIGDWGPFLDLLDPFRDGDGGKRMGEYFKWCLKGFDDGLSWGEVINKANIKYAEKWGGNKVINFSGNYSMRK
ncbi:MAG: hypothetical protein A2099_07455 [Planctomycetes bacterium GWF2_39_10]|nr:MAG: hypothetical protein A2Y09_06770 [Planctomycetes bacterium GWA2_39_15]OHB47885.1 MAG: hypothetical protein A2099_07455 [Planctomycetes bacterium GWF2_39_10]